MKSVFFLILTITVLSCANQPETYIPHMEGYWEIKEVTLSSGAKRQYNYNDTIDFIEISDSLTGTRRKLKPNFQGTFETSKSVETFQIKIENDSLNMYYKTPYSNWKETVIKASDNELKIINNTNKDVYIYKRYQPINLDAN